MDVRLRRHGFAYLIGWVSIVVAVFGPGILGAEFQVAEHARDKAAANALLLLAVDRVNGLTVEGIGRSPEGRFLFRWKNDWLEFVQNVAPNALESLLQNRPGLSLPEDLHAFARRRFLPQPAVKAILKDRFGLGLSDVYVLPAPPFYSNRTGLKWDRENKRFVLQVHGVINKEKNRCWRAFVDLATGETSERNPVLCRVY